MKRAARLLVSLWIPSLALAQEPPAKVDRPPGELIVGVGPGWRPLKEGDFVHVNDEPDTWTFLDDRAEIRCKGTPVGVIRTKTPVRNFELVVEWRHLKSGGNSGVFVWAPEKALDGLKPGRLPGGGSRSRSSTTATPSSTGGAPVRRPTGSPPTATSSPWGRRR